MRGGVRRLDIGGKLLTNHLKVRLALARELLTDFLQEITSYRQLHVLDETYVMNACKVCCEIVRCLVIEFL